MHRPCILRDERSGQLITEGFAILSKVDDKVGVQQKLAEPLAVKAVIEHLRARVSGYNDMLKRLLFDSQDDPSSFGKAAEYYLAWVSLSVHHVSCPNTPQVYCRATKK